MAREFTWQGKSEEDLKKLDLKVFMTMTSSRIRRSLKRGFTPAQKMLLKGVTENRQNLETHCRDMVIIPSMIGKIIKVYNGKEFLPVMVTGEMLGHYLGEFSHTRKSVAHSAAGIGATRSSKAISAR